MAVISVPTYYPKTTMHYLIEFAALLLGLAFLIAYRQRTRVMSPDTELVKQLKASNDALENAINNQTTGKE